MVKRCAWVPKDDEVYMRYHDEEWGRPATNANDIYSKLVLEGFQAGLSWATILHKRDRFREVFCDFEISAVAAFGPKQTEVLMSDAGIVRNRAKIEAAISNAQVAATIEQEVGLVNFIWDFAEPKHKLATDIPTETQGSQNLAKTLREKGWRFFGPTTAYAFMQSEGLVNDHVKGCVARKTCQEERLAFMAGLKD